MNETEATPTMEKWAEAIVKEMAKEPGLSALASDKPFLDFVTDLLKQLLPMLIGCFGTADAAAKALQSPNLLTKVRVRMTVRQHLRDDDTVNVLSQPLANAIFSVGKRLTTKQLTALSS